MFNLFFWCDIPCCNTIIFSYSTAPRSIENLADDVIVVVGHCPLPVLNCVPIGRARILRIRANPCAVSEHRTRQLDGGDPCFKGSPIVLWRNELAISYRQRNINISKLRKNVIILSNRMYGLTLLWLVSSGGLLRWLHSGKPGMLSSDLSKRGIMCHIQLVFCVWAFTRA